MKINASRAIYLARKLNRDPYSLTMEEKRQVAANKDLIEKLRSEK